MPQLDGKRIAILATDGFEQSELLEPKKALEQALPANVRAIVQRQYEGVVANHDTVRALRDKQRTAA